ncbi:Uncharacterised protein (plasmid) [Legionella adelaidensis]|uniref:Transmembrane protein n=1 Tax=Legionella adelaidensis TaxID=45056 RepID=A0A0W0R1W4_9GAMM|nr:hypothetical protein [Legionella adelaidensis]KTC65091.1 hypothetical protein Lade_1614 [Legionella adelaidensis]VEH85389.1 Uncharacterised protein [Legionella adelaidensis]
MLQIKAFTLNGKSPAEVFFTLIGIIGAITVLFGFSQPFAQIYYIVGASLLLFTALYFKLVYFIALELILIAGHGAILLGIGPIQQIILPSLLCLQLFVYYLLSNELKNIFRVIGVIGIALVSIGLSLTHIWVSLFGALSVAIYAGYEVHLGKSAAAIWFFLNLIFVLITGFLIFY